MRVLIAGRWGKTHALAKAIFICFNPVLKWETTSMNRN